MVILVRDLLIYNLSYDLLIYKCIINRWFIDLWY